jgi:hypothetical protein
MSARPSRNTGRLRPSCFLAVAVLAFVMLAAPSAFAITRATVLARAQSWVDIPVPYSQSKWFRGYRTDCSGFTSMSWQARTSFSTRSLWTVDTRIKSRDLKPGDALIKYDYHARIFYGWADAAHTRYVTYEQTGGATQINIKDLASDLAFGYRAYRYDKISDGAPQWNMAANPGFGTWANGSPVWWDVPGARWGSPAVAFRTTARTKAGKSALRLVNTSNLPSQVVELRQTNTVRPGAPYKLSLWANNSADPKGLDVRISFTNAAGQILFTSPKGDVSHIGTAALAAISLAATAPANATSATISIRLAGGFSSDGATGTAAVIDSVSLYDASPARSVCALSSASVDRSHSVTLEGTVTAPVAYGSVRIYVVRPGTTKAVVLGDRKLSGGTWSMKVTPTIHGAYGFTAKYLGFGPWGTVTSSSAALQAK